MAGDFNATGPRFGVLRFMAALKAARDFGLDDQTANAISLRFNPHGCNAECLLDELAATLIQRGALRIPESV